MRTDEIAAGPIHGPASPSVHPGTAAAAVELTKIYGHADAEALAEADAAGERFYEAELHRSRAELLADGEPTSPAEAHESLARAVAVARVQGARALDRRAEGSLRRLQVGQTGGEMTTSGFPSDRRAVRNPEGEPAGSSDRPRAAT